MPSPFQIALGLKRLASIESFRRDRAEAVNRYFKLFKNHPGIELPPRCPTLSHFPVLTAGRDALLALLISRGIHSTVIFKRTLPAILGQDDRKWPAARRLAAEMVILPLFLGMPRRIAERTVRLVTKAGGRS